MQRSPSIQLGPYQFHERLGEGGSGQVYRATGPTGVVAVKILGPAGDLDDSGRARFRREIQALGQLAHPNLVTLIDHGIDPELGPYLVLPLLAGVHLRALALGRALCPEAAILLARPIAGATAALHAAGYIHRDLKPENAIANPDGTVTVIDLGLAWREGMTRHTESGAAVGSVGYMAPEQIDGRTVEPAADIWAIGVMLYEWITGKRPFARTRPAEEAAAALVGSFAPLGAVDRRVGEPLAQLAARCLAMDPARRPTAIALAAELDALIDWIPVDDQARERAIMIADPAGYQAKVAPFRVQRAERLARASLEAGKPFVALAQCDRGLAYAPDHAALAALIAEAEQATANVTPPTPVPAAVLVAGAATATPISGVETGALARRQRFVLVTAAVGALGVVGIVAYLATRSPAPAAPGSPSGDPWNQPTASSPVPSVIQTPNDRDREAIMTVFGVMGKVVDRVQTHEENKLKAAQPAARPTPDDRIPTTATGWLARARTQAPDDAVASIRHALALNPGWPEAQVRLCVALAEAEEDGALDACEAIALARPGDVAVLGARATAYLRADRAEAALADLDRVVAVDADPKWRRLRARARIARGDRAGARLDHQRACELGDAVACKEL